MYTLDVPLANEYPDLVSIWESSVRATHHFLKEEHILAFRKLIAERYLYLVRLLCVRDDSNKIMGFMGVSSDNIEMLFIDASARGKGVGKLLVNHAINTLQITKVDVNEQNEQAIGFYKLFGFKVISRDEVDGTGKPYPILHMRRTAKGNLV